MLTIGQRDASILALVDTNDAGHAGDIHGQRALFRSAVGQTEVKIILFLALTLPGTPPIQQHFDAPSVEACLEQAADILIKAQGMRRLGMVQAGCVVKVEEEVQG
jgi:hypothetical protein